MTNHTRKESVAGNCPAKGFSPVPCGQRRVGLAGVSRGRAGAPYGGGLPPYFPHGLRSHPSSYNDLMLWLDKEGSSLNLGADRQASHRAPFSPRAGAEPAPAPLLLLGLQFLTLPEKCQKVAGSLSLAQNPNSPAWQGGEAGQPSPPHPGLPHAQKRTGSGGHSPGSTS